MSNEERIVRRMSGGEAVFKSTRLPVREVLTQLASGKSQQQLLGDFPKLTEEDIQAAIEFAAVAAATDAEAITSDGWWGRFFKRAKSFWNCVAKPSFFFLFIVVPVSLWWWRYAGATDHFHLHRTLLIAVSLASFMVGCLVGFLFSSYGEEMTTIGKIRDWLIGALTGITVAEALRQGGVFKQLLLKFTYQQNDNEFGLVLSMAVVYFSLGFLFMFFQRELILNVVLAKSRAERGQLDGTRQAAFAIQKLLAQLPASILSGVSDIDETKVGKKEQEDLRSALYTDDVNTFLKQAEEVLKSGAPLGWDEVSKVAHIQYYRAYFEEGSQRALQVKKALDWIMRALALNPLHADLTMKYADMLGQDGQLDAAEAVLEGLTARPEVPAVVAQWLGYYLRSNPSRVDKSIEYSNKFLALFPGDNGTKFNLAYAYGVKYCQELKAKGSTSDPSSANRQKALEYLGAALSEYPDFKTTVATKWIDEGKGFECLASDEVFKKLVGKQTALQ
jgi:uncharacterized protein (DUF433 family)